MYFDIFDKDEPIFNRKLANRYVLMIRKGTNEEAKLDLYRLMKKLIVKNVKNYAKLARNSSVTEACLEEAEMYGEAFIVLMKCTEKFKVKKGNCFYFYFNKSLSRNFYRMFDREVRKLDGYRGYRGEANNKVKNRDVFKDDIYSVKFVSDCLDLDGFDKKVLESKLLFQKKDDFIVNNNDATISRYYASIRKIKSQVQILKDNGDI